MRGARVIRLVLFAFVIAVVQRQCMAFDDDLKLEAKSSKALVEIYRSNGTLKQRIKEAEGLDGPEERGDFMAWEDRSRILSILYVRKDSAACAFFRESLTTPPRGINRRYIDRDFAEEKRINILTERFVAERSWAYGFFTGRADFVDSTTLFSEIRQYPCLVPHAAHYIVSKRERFTPRLREQLAELDLSRDGEYFDAWARYLKIKILNRPAAQVDNDVLVIRDVFLKSLEGHADSYEEEPTNNFYFMLSPIAVLARDKNPVAMQAMFDILPQLDGHAGEAMDGTMGSIATADFDFFMAHAHRALSQDKIDDLLKRLWCNESISDGEFKEKYAARLNDKTYAYYPKMILVLNGPPGGKRMRDYVTKK